MGPWIFFHYNLPLPSGETTTAVIIQKPTGRGSEYAVNYLGKELGVETSLSEAERVLFRGLKKDLQAKLDEAEKAREILRNLGDDFKTIQHCRVVN